MATREAEFGRTYTCTLPDQYRNWRGRNGRKYNPTFLDLVNVREDIEIWDPDKDEVERFLQGLQKAGLKYGSADSAATGLEPKLKGDPTAARGEATDSGSRRAYHRSIPGKRYID